MRQLELAVGNLAVLPLVLSFVTQKLSAGVQHIVAVFPDAMNMIASLGESTAGKSARVWFHELLEAVFQQLLVLDVIRLVFL